MLHEFLSAHRNKIVERCEAIYRESHPDLSSEELLDTVPEFLDEIIKAERREAGLPEATTIPGETKLIEEHTRRRFERGFPIAALARDYGAISQAIGELALEESTYLDPASYRVLNECLDTALAQSITRYLALSVEHETQTMTEWLGFLAHELRNALSTAVLSYSFIRSGRVGPQSRTGEVLERSFNRLESLVAQTLAAVQLEAHVASRPQPVNLHELVEDVDAGALHERNVRIVNQVPAGLTAMADERLLMSAVTNLVQNALKFTKAGGTIWIRGRQDPTAVVLDIEDECGGLSAPPEVLFEPFVQRDNNRSGIGLGLTISRKAIEAHGGTLTAADRPGKGCVFTIALPATGG
jgi:signal transduction histidine kinase